mmetsp:Transcript_19775/g.51770  ORF Transcript_19775/g.51770 Transcript_19775/m.51770 type:complete len:165 (-) Transcript_19775:629-1123(-)
MRTVLPLGQPTLASSAAPTPLMLLLLLLSPPPLLPMGVSGEDSSGFGFRAAPGPLHPPPLPLPPGDTGGGGDGDGSCWQGEGNGADGEDGEDREERLGESSGIDESRGESACIDDGDDNDSAPPPSMPLLPSPRPPWPTTAAVPPGLVTGPGPAAGIGSGASCL